MDKIIKLLSHNEAQALAGLHDENLKKLEKEFSVKTVLRGDHVKISGTPTKIKKAVEFVDSILERIRSRGTAPTGADFRRYLSASSEDSSADAAIGAGIRHGHIGPKTRGQREYVEAINAHDIVFGIGPAGTGKTYLAMSCAVEALKSQRVRRIILTRPAVEAAGESLGFLPGGVHEKIAPYLRPLYDALYDMMDAERIEKYIETGIIEVAPLAYMRGRTLNDAFIILDEAQNCTAEQMKMFLTRLGFESKAVITGDVTQSDLPGGKPTGLIQAQEVLRQVEGIQFIYFSGSDVVRHALVQRIIEAYERPRREG
jgi:phosphate starvation-inducible protein PhoH and related proteins